MPTTASKERCHIRIPVKTRESLLHIGKTKYMTFSQVVTSLLEKVVQGELQECAAIEQGREQQNLQALKLQQSRLNADGYSTKYLQTLEALTG